MKLINNKNEIKKRFVILNEKIITYENIKECMDFYKIGLDNLIVIYDDIDVEKGEVKLLVNSPKNDVTKRLVEYSFISKEDIDNWSDL